MNFKHLGVAVAVAILGFNSSGNANPLYAAVSGTGSLAISTTTLADSFTTDGTGAVSEVEIALAKSSTSTTGSTLITIYSDNGQGLANPTLDAPKSLIATVGTIADSSISSTNTLTLFDFTSLALSLNANTEYFVEIARSGTTNSSAKYYTDLAAPTFGASFGGHPEVFYKSSVGTAATPPEAQICVSDDTTCTVQFGGTATVITGAAQLAAPEPTSLGILGSGLIGFGFIASRRRRRAHAG